jgi:hypothetical protein
MKSELLEGAVFGFHDNKPLLVVRLDADAMRAMQSLHTKGQKLPDWQICGKEFEESKIAIPSPSPNHKIKTGTQWVHLATPDPQWFLTNFSAQQGSNQ